MATERQKFMYKQSCADFDNLQKNIGEKVKIYYTFNGSPLEAIGILKAVEPFKKIITAGGEIPFVSREKMIRLIENKETNQAIYDRSYIIPKNAKVQGDLSRYKLAIMGAEQPLKDKTFEFVDNLRQDT